MEYRRFENTIIARIDKGEEILEQVKIIALTENIQLASVQALGAVGKFTVGVFRTEQKIYQSNEFQGDFEIVSLVGTINTMNHEFYCHLHMSAVSATCEMVISIVNGDVDRCYSDEIGLNLFDFSR